MAATVADASASAATAAGAGLFPGLGGPFHGFGGDDLGGSPWAPYIPVTPLGALGGVKGDLLVPIVAVGFALFILLIIVLAVKAALMWKVQVVDDFFAPARTGARFQREINSNANAALPEDDMLNHLSEVVMSAISSKCWSQRIICDVGSYARQRDDLPRLLKMVELITPEAYKSSLQELRASAEGDFDCQERFNCAEEEARARQPAAAASSANKSNADAPIDKTKVPSTNSKFRQRRSPDNVPY